LTARIADSSPRFDIVCFGIVVAAGVEDEIAVFISAFAMKILE